MATSPESKQMIVLVVCGKTLIGLGTDYCFGFETITGNLTKLLVHKMVSVTVA